MGDNVSKVESNMPPSITDQCAFKFTVQQLSGVRDKTKKTMWKREVQHEVKAKVSIKRQTF